MTTRPPLGERHSYAGTLSHGSPRHPAAAVGTTIADRDPARARRLTQGLRAESRPEAYHSAPVVAIATVASPEPTPLDPALHRAPRSGYRRNAIFHMHGKFDWRLLDRNQRAKLWSVAQSMERLTKQKGDRNGCLGAVGLNVLNALLFRFLNGQSGRCDPSYNTLQKLTGYCRQSISNAIDRLEASGLVTVTRRMMRFKERVLCALTGRSVDVVIVRQISNAYVLTDPAQVTVAARPGCATKSPARPFPARRAPSVFAAALAGIQGRFSGRPSGVWPSLPDRGNLKQPLNHPLAPRHLIVQV
jgi:hypothetical protein